MSDDWSEADEHIEEMERDEGIISLQNIRLRDENAELRPLATLNGMTMTRRHSAKQSTARGASDG